MADKYITKEELRIEPYELNLDDVDNKYIETLQDLTKRIIDNVCGQDFDQEGTPEVPSERFINGTGRDTVFMDKRIVTLTQIKIYTAVNLSYDYEPENFFVKPKYISWRTFDPISARIVVPVGIFPEGVANIGVVGIWGYTEIPEPIKYLQGRLIQKIIEDKTFAEKVKTEKIGDYSYENKASDLDIFGDAELDNIVLQYRSPLNYGTA